MLNWNQIEQAEPEELSVALKTHFSTKLPTQIETAEEMREAQKLLSKLASQYSFLTSISVEVKNRKRKMKREKAEKELIDAMMEREDLLNAYCESVKMSYNAISRMITIRQQIYEELRMTSSMP